MLLIRVSMDTYCRTLKLNTKSLTTHMDTFYKDTLVITTCLVGTDVPKLTVIVLGTTANR